MREIVFILVLLFFHLRLIAQNEVAQQLIALKTGQEKENYYAANNISLDELDSLLDVVKKEDERLELLLYYVYTMFSYDASKALAQSTEALSLARKLNKPVNEGFSLSSIAAHYSLQPNNSIGLLYADSALQVAKSINDYVMWARIYKVYSNIYTLKEKYDSSTYYYLKSTELTNEHASGYTKHVQRLSLSNYALSHDNLELAESTLNNTNYDELYSRQVDYLLLKTKIHILKNNIDSVSFYFRKALDNFLNKSSVYEKLAKYLIEKNNLDSALNVCYKAISLKDPRESYFDEIYKEIAFIYDHKGMYDSAEYYLKKCIADNIRLNEDFILSKSNNRLASFYLKHNQYDSASKYAQVAYDMAKELELTESLVGASYNLSLIAAHHQDYQKAYSYSEENRAYTKKLNQAKVTQLLKETEIKKHFEQWIATQQKNIEKAERNKNTVIIIAIFLFIILTLLYLRYRANYKALITQRKLNEKINDQYEEIQSQGEELATMNEELSTLNDELELRIAKRTEDLKNSNEQLELYNNRLMQYANLTAHNIKAPLASIKGLVSLLNKDISSIDDVITITKHIQSSSLELDIIIGKMSDLMNIDKISKNEYEIIQIESIIEEIEHWFIVLTQGKVLEIHKKISIDNVYTVKRYLVSVLKELCQNAFNFKNPDCKFKVNIEVQKVKEHIAIKVQDNGLGIDLAKHRDDIFKIHKRFHDDMKGRGIGLYYVKRKIEALGGNIAIESEPQQGTSFVINLPST